MFRFITSSRKVAADKYKALKVVTNTTLPPLLVTTAYVTPQVEIAVPEAPLLSRAPLESKKIAWDTTSVVNVTLSSLVKTITPAIVLVENKEIAVLDTLSGENKSLPSSLNNMSIPEAPPLPEAPSIRLATKPRKEFEFSTTIQTEIDAAIVKRIKTVVNDGCRWLENKQAQTLFYDDVNLHRSHAKEMLTIISKIDAMPCCCLWPRASQKKEDINIVKALRPLMEAEEKKNNKGIVQKIAYRLLLEMEVIQKDYVLSRENPCKR